MAIHCIFYRLTLAVKTVLHSSEEKNINTVTAKSEGINYSSLVLAAKLQARDLGLGLSPISTPFRSLIPSPVHHEALLLYSVVNLSLSNSRVIFSFSYSLSECTVYFYSEIVGYIHGLIAEVYDLGFQWRQQPHPILQL